MQSIARLPNVGLAPDPIAPASATVAPFTGEVVKLPYQGPSLLDDTIGKPYPTEQLRMRREPEVYSAHKAEELDDPAIVLTRKIDRMARLLGCSVHDAERILFDRL